MKDANLRVEFFPPEGCKKEEDGRDGRGGRVTEVAVFSTLRTGPG